MKTYIVRAVKYFFFFWIILVILMAIFVVAGIADPNPATMFKNGYNSYWQIGLFFAGMSALYPKFGYTTRRAHIPGEFSENKKEIIECMETRNYTLENETEDTLSFRHKSAPVRLMRMFEDRITLTKEFTGCGVEGPTKDIARVISALEYKFNNNED